MRRLQALVLATLLSCAAVAAAQPRPTPTTPSAAPRSGFPGATPPKGPAGAPPANGASGDASRAAALFDEGVAAIDRGDFVTACTKLGESLTLVERASTLLNLALCETEQGKLSLAVRHYKRAIALLPPDDKRLPTATARMDELSRRVPRLVITLAKAVPASATVRIDDVEIAPSDLAEVPVDPGEHRIVLVVPGRADVTTTAKVAEGERRELHLKPGAALTPPPDPDAKPREEPSDALRIAGYVVLGVGVAGVVVAAVTGGMLLANDATIDDNCPGQRCNPEGLETIDESESLFIGNAVGWAVAIAGVGTGAALLIVDAVQRGEDSEEPVSAGVVATPDGASFVLHARF
jgi:hypothetical protein